MTTGFEAVLLLWAIVAPAFSWRDALDVAHNNNEKLHAANSSPVFNVSTNSTATAMLGPPWTMPRCTSFWGKPFPESQIPSTRDLFDFPSELDEKIIHGIPTRKIDPALSALMSQNLTWPPEDRGSVDDFFRAVGSRRSKLKPGPSNWAASAMVDHSKRSIVIKMLKSGSTTVGHLMLQRELREARRAVNATEKMLRCFNTSPLPPDCQTPTWVTVKTIPDAVHDAYFVFTFTRDPFTRAVSSLAEAGGGSLLSFTDVVAGNNGRVGRNVHFVGQFVEASAPIFSGKQIRLDFVGRLESLSEDWARIRPALVDNALIMSPRERQGLVLPRVENISVAIPHHRESGSASANLLPYSKEMGRPEPFRLLHVILVCRRYIQDLVCFNMGVPRVCIDHAELVLDLV